MLTWEMQSREGKTVVNEEVAPEPFYGISAYGYS
jgi:hypothetical protein